MGKDGNEGMEKERKEKGREMKLEIKKIKGNGRGNRRKGKIKGKREGGKGNKGMEEKSLIP